MTLAIRAKPTLYKGIRFRSRLEARWAIFLDALDVEWVYEPAVEGVQGYLPDFQVGDTWFIEVKPESWQDRSPSSDHDISRFASFLAGTERHLFVTHGAPGEWENGKLVREARGWAFTATSCDKAKWQECKRCGFVGVVAVGSPVCSCPQLYDRLRAAYNAVRDHSYEDAS